jgi:hypothetical protein
MGRLLACLQLSGKTSPAVFSSAVNDKKKMFITMTPGHVTAEERLLDSAVPQCSGLVADPGVTEQVRPC